MKMISIVAELPVTDLNQTKAFCEDILEGKLVAEYPDFLIYSVEGIELHFWLCTDKNLPENSSIYLRVENIDEYYRKYVGGKYIALPLQLRPWGIKEFYLKDEEGILYKFGEFIN